MIHSDIPRDFYSDIDEKPFVKCMMCECDLTDGQKPYTIEKAFKRVDNEQDVTLYEIAICLECAEKQAMKMSKESRKYIEGVMMNSGFMQQRSIRWEQDWERDWKERCLFTKAPIKRNDEYHIIGHFQGRKIIPQLTPFVMGQDFIAEIQENLSKETKDEMNRFGEQFLGPDPTLKALLADDQFILV